MGIISAIKSERNLKFHIFAGFSVIVCALFLEIEISSIAVLVLTISLVIVCELLNTAIETVIDLVCGEKLDPLAKKAKDVAAGAVLVSSIGAVIIGACIFFDKIVVIIGRL